MFRPRDIMLVLDFSASMNDDSELKSIDALGQDVVEAGVRDSERPHHRGPSGGHGSVHRGRSL